MSNINPRWGDWAKRPDPIPEEKITEQASCDVLVIGAGIAGMTCALSAAQCGNRVIVLEKTGGYSGRGFNIGVVNSSLMKEQGFENDPDAVAREWIKRCSNRCDERIVRRFVDRGGEAMDWLVEIVTRPEYDVKPALQGCIYKGETYYEIYGSHMFFDGPIARQGKFGGINDVMEPMYQEALKLGTEFRFRSPMAQLIREDGRVTGAVYERDGAFGAVRASKGVVLATGGIGGNWDMCEDLAPVANKCAQKVYWPKGGNDGDGHRAALWVGAAFDDGPFPTIMHPQANRHASCCFLFVRPDGKRFMNEDNYLQARSLGVIKEGLKYAWSIFDSDWRVKIPATLPYGGGLYWGNDFPVGKSEFQEEYEESRFQWGLETGNAVMADTPEELAEKMGVDPAGFAETLRHYNEMCANGHDDEFGKRRELLIPLDKPPYIARKFGPALLAVVGGVRVDEHMRALTETGEPVPGLFAIGNTSGGRYGTDYPMLLPGNSHGTALTFGYLLGREIADLS